MAAVGPRGHSAIWVAMYAYIAMLTMLRVAGSTNFAGDYIVKYFFGIAGLVALAACGDNAEPDVASPDINTDTAEVAAPAAAEAFALPYDLPLAPDTRIINGNSFESGGQMESVASLATTGDPKAVLDFYEGELTNAGWEVYSRGGNPDRPMFAAKKDDLRIQASLFGSGEGLAEGERDVRLTAKYPK
mgnify:CR=1 FL=1